MITNKIKGEIVNLYYRDYKFFFSKPNVTGVAYGYKFKNGINTCEPCIHVFVEKKIGAKCLSNSEFIPCLYKGVKTDVIETGKFHEGNERLSNNSFCNEVMCKSIENDLIRNPVYTGRVRPIQPGWGMSNGNSRGRFATGTFGYIVTDNKRVSETYCLLSVNKTFADYNNEEIGSEIIQPSFRYGGRKPQDTVAKLLRYDPLNFKNPNAPMPPLEEFNAIDASIASIYFSQQVQLINPYIPPNFIIIAGKSTPDIGKNVSWTGCFSGGQTGSILSINAIVKVNYVNGLVCWFKDVIVTSGASVYGDQGALVYDNERKAVGMFFALGLTLGNLVCNINSIEEILDVTLVTG